jgi:hypothetical protein
VVKLVSERVIDSIQSEVRLELVAAVEVLDYYKSTTILEGSVNIPRGEVSKVGLIGRNM